MPNNSNYQPNWDSTPGSRSGSFDNNQKLLSGLYLGIIKDARDPQRMGRVRVAIPDLSQGNINDPSYWYIVSYMSPFAGATPIVKNVKDSHNMEGSQQSYGFWFPNQGIDDQVIIAFLGGDPTRGVVLGALFHTNMNFSIPTSSLSKVWDVDNKIAMGAGTEYNKYDYSLTESKLVRPMNTPLMAGLGMQGLLSDPVRGIGNSSARREAPSNVLGLKSPRGHSIVIDDGHTTVVPKNINTDGILYDTKREECEPEFIKLRTRTGVQIMLNDTTGEIFMSSRNGQGWIQVSDNGVDIYSRTNYSIRTTGDLNFHADKNINFYAGGTVAMNSQDSFRIQSRGEFTVGSVGELKIVGKGDINVSSKGDLITKGNEIHLFSGTNKIVTSNIYTNNAYLNNVFANRSFGAVQNSMGSVNYPNNPDASGVGIQQITIPDRETSAPVYPTQPSRTTTSRTPTHQPYSGMPKCSGGSVVPADSGTNFYYVLQGGAENINGNGSASGADGSGNNTDTTTDGDGNTQRTPVEDNSPTINCGNYKISDNVRSSIESAASTSGVPASTLYSIIATESSFNINAVNSSTNAQGLGQFLPSTWNSVTTRYGAQYGYSPSTSPYDPLANARMTAAYVRENQAVLARTNPGLQQNATTAYMAHFLGAGGASKFYSTEPSAIAASVFPSAAQYNRNIFYNSDGSPRTIQQVEQVMANKVSDRRGEQLANCASQGSGSTAQPPVS